MAEIKIEIQGEGAKEAAAELLEIPGIEGTSEAIADKERDALATVVLVTILATAAGNLVSTQLLEWHQKAIDRKRGYRIEKVMILAPNGDRILLKDATVEQIRRIVQ